MSNEKLFTETEIAEQSQSLQPPVAGVYFLLLNKRVIYVGKSTDVGYRIYTHRSNGKVFDTFFVISEDDSDMMTTLEDQYIRALRPALNIRTSTGVIKKRNKRKNNEWVPV